MKCTPSHPSPAPAPYLLPDGPSMRIGSVVRAENLPMDSGEPKNSDSIDPLANKVISRIHSPRRKPAASASHRPPTGGIQKSGPHYPHGSLQDLPNQGAVATILIITYRQVPAQRFICSQVKR